ncbi:hypothetical protein AGLY_007764 [Aphis glycines]|uniref:Uncharacterized protein n=1 Tax=Aphis glycines TaxID=307491 RepID=A0A6G0TP69_APHGL|nr:hypothetical protein AGLY_007764 [Aphis glycines]
MKAPEYKPLVRPEKPEDVRAKFLIYQIVGFNINTSNEKGRNSIFDVFELRLHSDKIFFSLLTKKTVNLPKLRFPTNKVVLNKKLNAWHIFDMIRRVSCTLNYDSLSVSSKYPAACNNLFCTFTFNSLLIVSASGATSLNKSSSVIDFTVCPLDKRSFNFSLHSMVTSSIQPHSSSLRQTNDLKLKYTTTNLQTDITK